MKTKSIRTALSVIANAIAFFIPALFIWKSLEKAKAITDAIDPIVGTHNGFILPALHHDTILLGIILLLLYSCGIIRNRIVNSFLRMAILLIILLYLLDYQILRLFRLRLIIREIPLYLKGTSGVFSDFLAHFFTAHSSLYLITVAAAGFTLILGLVTAPLRLPKMLRRALLLLSIICIGIYCVPKKESYCFSWSYQNVFEYNLMAGKLNRRYSSEFKKRLLTQPPPTEKICITKAPNIKNVVLLVLESLSSANSSFFSGLKDKTPQLDRIAQENLSFLNFYANGFTTIDGLISLLTGLPPSSLRWTLLNNEKQTFPDSLNTTKALPHRLRRNGYTCEFLTSGDLSFTDKGKWLDAIGFEYKEGHTHPFYEQWQRFLFKAAPDEALYERAYERIVNTPREKPFFIVIETVTGHRPFLDPETGSRSADRTMAYVDKQLGAFYDRLNNSGFFKSGMLIIVGDHRSMTPVTRAEFEKYGFDRAPAKVPLIICSGEDLPAVEKRAFQQTDIPASILNYVSPQACTNLWQGDLLATPRIPPAFIRFRRGDQRNVISVFHKEHSLRIHLCGDTTHLTNSAGFTPQQKKIILETINRDRILLQMKTKTNR